MSPCNQRTWICTNNAISLIPYYYWQKSWPCVVGLTTKLLINIKKQSAELAKLDTLVSAMEKMMDAEIVCFSDIISNGTQQIWLIAVEEKVSLIDHDVEEKKISYSSAITSFPCLPYIQVQIHDNQDK